MPIDFICPICDTKIAREMRVITPHIDAHIVDAIKEKHPEWVSKDGICKRCYEYYKKELHPD